MKRPACRSARFLALCLVLLAGSGLSALAADFQGASALYDAGKFAEAAAAYDAIHPKTAAVQFNLGNAWFRLDKLGWAVLAYERARQLSPRDPDVLANLRFAQTRLGVIEANRPPTVWGAFWETMVARLTRNEWTLLEVLAWWGSLVAVAGWVWWPRGRSGWTIVFALAVICLVLSASALLWQTTRPAPVVAVGKAEARFAPLTEATVHFPVLEGTRLGLLEDRGLWWFVERADGRRGWVPAQTLRAVALP